MIFYSAKVLPYLVSPDAVYWQLIDLALYLTPWNADSAVYDVLQNGDSMVYLTLQSCKVKIKIT